MLFAVSSLITTLANVFLGIFVYLRNPQKKENRVFFLLTISLSLWIATLYLYYNVSDPHWLLFLGRINFAFPTLTIYYLFCFTYYFPEISIRLSKLVTYLIGFLAYLMAFIAAFTPFIDQGERIVGPERIVDYGPMYILWVIYFVALPSIALALLFVKLKRASGRSKSQLKYLLAGTGLTYFFSVVTNILLPYGFGLYSLQPVGPIATLFLTGLTTYAIIRHKFLDITAIVARAVSYTLILAIVVLIEVAIFWVGTKILPSNIDRTLVAFAGSILIVLGYSSLNSVITGVTDKIFFQGRYDPETLLKKLTSIMVSEMNVEFLKIKLIKTLTTEMKVGNSNFVLISDFSSKPPNLLDLGGTHQDRFHQLEPFMRKIDQTLVFEDLTDEVYKEIFRQLNLSVILPLRVGEDQIGLLILGPKLSGDIYQDRDLKFLEIFAPQAAIALKNADSYRQIQEFNQTLELKVIDRTHELAEAQAAELKLKDEFVFIATHDLATPVTAISGFSAMIKNMKVQLPEALTNDLAAIDEASSRLKVLVNDLLQVARSDSGTIKVELAPVDAKEIISAALRQASPAAQDKKVQIVESYATGNLIQADSKKLSEIVENLISNGIKYNKEGGSLTITTVDSVKNLIIEFKDTGLGIPTAEQGKVFTKFFRSEEAEVRQRPGTGLGLFVVRMLTEKMGGKISFKSEEGIGTTFRLEFSH